MSIAEIPVVAAGKVLSNFVDAVKNGVQFWDPAKHPRDRVGRFLEVGDVVRAYKDKESVLPETVGKVKASWYDVPTGRLFIGIDVGDGQMAWYRPKQLENIKVKAKLDPKIPLPALVDKQDELHWDSKASDATIGELALATANPNDYVPSGVVKDLDAKTKASIGLATMPTSDPLPQSSAKLPKDKTPEQALAMVTTTLINKGLQDSYPGGLPQWNDDFDAMLADTDLSSSSQKLAKLMTAAKLGGKQRKRYTEFLVIKHGGSSGAMKVVGTPEFTTDEPTFAPASPSTAKPAPAPELLFGPWVAAVQAIADAEGIEVTSSEHEGADGWSDAWATGKSPDEFYNAVKKKYDLQPPPPAAPVAQPFNDWADQATAYAKNMKDVDLSHLPISAEEIYSAHQGGEDPIDWADDMLAKYGPDPSIAPEDDGWVDGVKTGGITAYDILSAKEGDKIVIPDMENAGDSAPTDAYIVTLSDNGTSLDLVGELEPDSTLPLEAVAEWIGHTLSPDNIKIVKKGSVDPTDEEIDLDMTPLVDASEIANTQPGDVVTFKAIEPDSVQSVWKFTINSEYDAVGEDGSVTSIKKLADAADGYLVSIDKPNAEIDLDVDLGDFEADLEPPSEVQYNTFVAFVSDIENAGPGTIIHLTHPETGQEQDYIVAPDGSLTDPDGDLTTASLGDIATEVEHGIWKAKISEPTSLAHTLPKTDGTSLEPPTKSPTPPGGADPLLLDQLLYAPAGAVVMVPGGNTYTKQADGMWMDNETGLATHGKHGFDINSGYLAQLPGAKVDPSTVPAVEVELETELDEVAAVLEAPAGTKITLHGTGPDEVFEATGDGSAKVIKSNLYGASVVSVADLADWVSTGDYTAELVAPGLPPSPPAPPAPAPTLKKTWPGPPWLGEYDAVYQHPQGSIIVVDYATETATKYKPDGKKAKTSATAQALADGHGAWTIMGMGPEVIAKYETGGAAPPLATPMTTADAPAKAPAAAVGPKPGTAIVDPSQDALLGLLKTTLLNKGLVTPEVQSQWQALLEEPTYHQAAVQLTKLMGTAKLGGNQRKKYKAALRKKYGMPEAEGAPPVQVPTVTTPAGVQVPYVSPLAGPSQWQHIKPMGATAVSSEKGGIIGPSKGNELIKSGGKSPQEAKRSIQDEISKRMVGRATKEQLVSASLDTQYSQSDHVKTLAQAVKSGKAPSGYKSLNRGTTSGIWTFSTVAPNPNNKNSVGVSPAEMLEALRSTQAHVLIQMWAGTSNDSNVRSLAMQEAAKAEFGLTNTYEWPQDLAGGVKKEFAAHGPLFRSFLRSMYEYTQEWGKANNVRYVQLRRGSSVYAGPVGSNVKVKLRPMSSFSSNASIAKRFGNNIIGAMVPIEWVVGTAATGFGCQNEYEYVLLGGVHEVRVMA